jgi:hypothetical protein
MAFVQVRLLTTSMVPHVSLTSGGVPFSPCGSHLQNLHRDHPRCEWFSPLALQLRSACAPKDAFRVGVGCLFLLCRHPPVGIALAAFSSLVSAVAIADSAAHLLGDTDTGSLLQLPPLQVLYPSILFAFGLLMAVPL